MTDHFLMIVTARLVRNVIANGCGVLTDVFVCKFVGQAHALRLVLD